jgi:hypothetical protein
VGKTHVVIKKTPLAEMPKGFFGDASICQADCLGKTFQRISPAKLASVSAAISMCDG